jgi:hypothetical protein
MAAFAAMTDLGLMVFVARAVVVGRLVLDWFVGFASSQ